ncbi:hypothetical protein M0R72_01050 [Candidatus Pacearchaeota archaeon]|nr:hypothetical protein [Candidatus Pacearchaeota archaeon]
MQISSVCVTTDTFTPKVIPGIQYIPRTSGLGTKRRTMAKVKAESTVSTSMPNEEAVIPVVGMGVTGLGYTDRYPYTVIEVIDDKTLRIQEDKATRTDTNGMSESQSYDYEADPKGKILTIVLRKNGQWHVKIPKVVPEATRFQVGVRRKYHDYSF